MFQILKQFQSPPDHDYLGSKTNPETVCIVKRCCYSSHESFTNNILCPLRLDDLLHSLISQVANYETFKLTLVSYHTDVCLMCECLCL